MTRPVESPDELQPILDLWHAALEMYLTDARDFVTGKRADPDCILETAYADLIRCGPRTRWLSRFCLVDAEEISRQFRRWLAEHRDAA